MDSLSPLSSFILQQVFPAVGVLTGTFMSFAPYRAVLKASQKGTLGDLNPTPWVFMLGNCAGWVAYSYFTTNLYVLLPNVPGFILAIWLNIQAIKLQYENYRSTEFQTAIIEALENHKSGKKMVNKAEIQQVVEQVVDEPPPIEILAPVTTAPVTEEESDDQSTDEDGYESDIEAASTAPRRLSLKKRFSFRNNNNDDQDGAGTVAEAAAEMIVDYASFVWDIAAQRTQAPASHELLVVGISTFWLLLLSFVVFAYQNDLDQQTLIIGLAVNANLIFFYGAPLSKIATVLTDKSSKSIHVPTMVCSLINGSLWFVYGVAVRDFYIAVPNGFGAALGVLQLVLCLAFPRHKSKRLDEFFKEEIASVASSTKSSEWSLPAESTPLI